MKRYLITAPNELQLTTRLEIAPTPKEAKLQASRYWFETGQQRGLSLRHRMGLSSFIFSKRIGLFSCCQAEWSGLTGQLITTCQRCRKQCLTADAMVDEVLDALLLEDLEQSLTTLGVTELLSELDEHGFDLLIRRDRWGLLEKLGTLNLLQPLLSAATPKEIVRLHTSSDPGARRFAVRLHGHSRGGREGPDERRPYRR